LLDIAHGWFTDWMTIIILTVVHLTEKSKKTQNLITQNCQHSSDQYMKI